MKQNSLISNLVDEIISLHLYLQEQNPDIESDEIRRNELGWHMHDIYEDIVEKIRILHTLTKGIIPHQLNKYNQLKFIFNNI